MKKGVFILILATLGIVAVAQVGSSVSMVSKNSSMDTVSLNIKMAVEVALSDNPTIKIAGEEIERQRYVRNETVGNLMPNLNATGSYGYNLMNPVMFLPDGAFGPGTGGAMSMGFDNSFAGGFALQVPLYVPTVYATLKLNDEQRRQAVEQARSSKINLAQSVKKSYYTVLLAETSLELIRDNIDLAKEVVRTNLISYKQGVISEYDLITSEVQLSNLSPTLYEAKSALYNAKLMLNMLIGFPINTPLSMEEDLVSFVDYINENNEFNTDLGANSELKLVDIQQKMLNHQLKIQKAVRIPTLAAVGSYQVLTQDNTFNLGNYDWRGTSAVGLQLSIPIFTGLKNINRERQIINQQSQLKLQRDYLEENLSVEVHSSIANILSAKKQMEANVTAKELAKKGYRIAKIRYDTGMGTIVDLNTAQVQLMQADLSYAQSIYNCMSAQADYNKSIGSDF